MTDGIHMPTETIYTTPGGGTIIMATDYRGFTAVSGTLLHELLGLAGYTRGATIERTR